VKVSIFLSPLLMILLMPRNIIFPKTEIFKCKINEHYNDYVEIININDSLTGFFYGVLDSKNKPNIFYKSLLENLKVTDSTIYFTLEKFTFSNKSFKQNILNKIISPNDARVSAIFNFPLNYYCTRFSDTLKVYRSCMVYDSKSDYFEFVKIK